MNSKIYIIAEMAYSHDGSVGLAKKIVQNAADAGANAISIHITHVPSYMTVHYKTGKGRVSEGKDVKPMYEYLDEISLSFDEWKEVVKTVREHKLDLMIMPNDKASLDFSYNLQPDSYVIPLSSFDEYDFVKEVGNRKIPVYLRVGGATIGEIETVINILYERDNKQVVLLYGHQNYPTEIDDVNLQFLTCLKNTFGLPVGIADHVDADDDFATIAPLLSIPLGVSCIEKHITYDRSEKGEDFESALNKEEFKTMVERIRKAEKALSKKSLFDFTSSTKLYRDNLRKRVVAARDIKAGEPITEDMIICKRSDEGLFPSKIETICGLVPLRDIKKDQGIVWELFCQEP
jgi:sialic acid synthase SpsE